MTSAKYHCRLYVPGALLLDHPDFLGPWVLMGGWCTVSGTTQSYRFREMGVWGGHLLMLSQEGNFCRRGVTSSRVMMITRSCNLDWIEIEFRFSHTYTQK
ncbi:hypothetical protein CEXT_716751 [Caerostris extrusa]|uniref:Uncharacterized protein n=1 Tax=Caerostris extrusa TaxID=172846 RepID=A0AAV4RLF9_CAEEX|nr:hypothetical protein CEXT_716751 [Caerostris extrusa]